VIDGFEADDIIGTVASSRLKKLVGFETFMVTPDKDFRPVGSTSHRRCGNQDDKDQDHEVLTYEKILEKLGDRRIPKQGHRYPRPLG
jgi:5'-3' exonuclease